MSIESSSKEKCIYQTILLSPICGKTSESLQYNALDELYDVFANLTLKQVILQYITLCITCKICESFDEGYQV